MAFSPGVGVGIRPAGEEGSVGAHRRRLSVNMEYVFSFSGVVVDSDVCGDGGDEYCEPE